MVAPRFTKESINRLRPRIQQTVDSLLDKMIQAHSKKAVDVVENFALPVASYVSTTVTLGGSKINKLMAVDYLWNFGSATERPPVAYSICCNQKQW
jgi:cytochrome P450